MKQLLTILLATVVTATAVAVPARRGFRTVTGPDGSPIAVQKVGDEYAHYFEDKEGRAMVQEGDRYVYASEAYISGLQARRAAKVRKVADIGRFAGTTFPGKGEQKAIVVLVEYQDVKFKLGDHAQAYFTDMLNKEGFSEYNATGSVRDYFLDSSNGAFDCTFDVYGPVTLKNNMAYYGGNDRYGNDSAPWEMVTEACEQLDSTVDFSQYDRDNDGIIDNVYVIYAGFGEASSDVEDSVWPHSYDVSVLGLTFDGKRLATYGCSNEWEYAFDENFNITGENPDGVGTFIHEFGHVLGLPDLYDTVNSYNYYTPGAWDVMDYGPYNNNSRTPPSYSSFERNAMGWIEPVELTAGEHQLGDLQTTGRSLSITNQLNTDEFYLIEYRRQQGWDAYIPGEGVLVWHIDYDRDVWDSNTVNNRTSHQYVDLIEADRRGLKENRDAGDCFPGSSAVTECSMKWWTDGRVNLALSGIALSADGTTASFVATEYTSGGGDEETGEAMSVSDVLYASMDASEATVRGYIVGYVPSGQISGTVFGATGNNVPKTNIVLADNSDETDVDFCIPVQLTRGDARDNLNLADNPDLVGRQVEVTGTLETYCSVNGLKGVTTYRILSGEVDGIEEVVTPADAPSVIYDLQGRKVVNPTRGLYIVNGQKVLL